MLLGLDVGTTHTKVGIYDADGACLAHATAPTPLEASGPGPPQHDPAALWRTSAGLVRRAAQRAGGSIAGLAVSSMGEAGVPLDAHGEPTYGVIPWYDGRSAPQMEALAGRLGAGTLFEITGLYPNGIHSVAKWCWLREHAPEAWGKTRLWLSVADYMAYRLTGVAVMEASLAARTMAYDVRSGHWSRAVLEAAALSSAFLPPVVASTTRVGTVTTEAAAEIGLAIGTPVFAGGHDHVCAAFACGALAPRVVVDSQGTAEALTAGLHAPPRTERSGGFGVGPHVAPGHSYLLGGVYRSGGALQWVKQLLQVDTFDALRALAEGVPPGTSPLFVARLLGASPPVNRPAAHGAFVRLHPDHGRAHLVRSVYEGVAFEIRLALEALELVTDERVRVIRMVGENASDPLWGRIRAAVLGRPLEVARHGDMVTAGDALLAGLGAGVYEDAAGAAQRTYRASTTFAPDPLWRERYDPIYAEYRAFAAQLDAAAGGTAHTPVGP
jgi:xylulokinase